MQDTLLSSVIRERAARLSTSTAAILAVLGDGEKLAALEQSINALDIDTTELMHLLRAYVVLATEAHSRAVGG